jgi:hypothetical protein
MEKKYNPWVLKDIDAGKGQLGTFVGSETDAAGITAKVLKDNAVANIPLCPPKGMDNAVLIGGYNVQCVAAMDYTPKVEDESTLCTFRFSFKTLVSPLKNGTYGVGASKSDSSPESNALPKA